MEDEFEGPDVSEYEDEFCYKCLAMIPVIREGIEVGRQMCGQKFASETETDCCPRCGVSGSLRLIPKAFLVLWDTDKRVAEYLTEDMEIRTGLTREERVTAKQIIDKYSGAEQPAKEMVKDYCI